MSEKKYENLSAMMDGEIELDDEMIQQLQSEPELLARWQRYHMIRDGLDNHLPATGMMDISSNVMASLEDEPTVLAPKRIRIPQKIMKQAAGLAVAASVATIAIVSVQTSQLAKQEGSGTIARIEQPRVDQSAIAQARLRNQAVQSKLNGYLVNHNEYSVSARMQGMMPYMRIVGDADNQRIRNEK